MNQGLAGLPDWPRTRLSVVRSGLLRSAVKRSDGPNDTAPTCLTVVPVAALRLRAGAGGPAISR